MGEGIAVPHAENGSNVGGNDPLFHDSHGSELAPNAPVENPKSSWPTRSTFAGRNNMGSVWEERRAAFYKAIPSTHWKDGLERKFWRLCVDNPVADAVTKFLATECTTTAAPVEPRVKAKSKAKAKGTTLKEPGRGRGKGRGRSVRGKAVCRQ